MKSPAETGLVFKDAVGSVDLDDLVSLSLHNDPLVAETDKSKVLVFRHFDHFDSFGQCRPDHHIALIGDRWGIIAFGPGINIRSDSHTHGRKCRRNRKAANCG
jgi:hypothetical protein